MNKVMEMANPALTSKILFGLGVLSFLAMELYLVCQQPKGICHYKIGFTK